MRITSPTSQPMILKDYAQVIAWVRFLLIEPVLHPHVARFNIMMMPMGLSGRLLTWVMLLCTCMISLVWKERQYYERPATFLFTWFPIANSHFLVIINTAIRGFNQFGRFQTQALVWIPLSLGRTAIPARLIVIRAHCSVTNATWTSFFSNAEFNQEPARSMYSSISASCTYLGPAATTATPLMISS